MNHMVRMRGDVIWIVDPKVMDSVVAEEILTAIRHHAQRLRTQNKPVLLMVDMTQLKEVDADTRRYVLQETSKLDFDRLAGFGKSKLMIQTVNMMLIARRMINEDAREQIKFFSSAKEAERWLLVEPETESS